MQHSVRLDQLRSPSLFVRELFRQVRPDFSRVQVWCDFQYICSTYFQSYVTYIQLDNRFYDSLRFQIFRSQYYVMILILAQILWQFIFSVQVYWLLSIQFYDYFIIQIYTYTIHIKYIIFSDYVNSLSHKLTLFPIFPRLS